MSMSEYDGDIHVGDLSLLEYRELQWDRIMSRIRGCLTLTYVLLTCIWGGYSNIPTISIYPYRDAMVNMVFPIRVVALTSISVWRRRSLTPSMLLFLAI